MKTYEVLREHDGDRVYRTGDRREAVPASVEHLVQLGVLRKAASELAAIPAPKSKGRRKVSAATVSDADKVGADDERP